MPINSSDTIANEQNASGFSLDYKRILYHTIRYWYWVVISILIFFSVAFLRNRYATRIFPVSASILIKETEETGGAELLYKNSLIDPYRNYLNELYIIKSYPLIQRVLEDLNFEISFYREGNFLTTETYPILPATVTVIDRNGIDNKKFHFMMLTKNEFQLFSNGGSADSVRTKSTFRFGDIIEYQGLKLKINRSDVGESFLNESFIVLFQAPSSLAGSYVSRLSAEWAEEGSGVVNLSLSGSNPEKDIDFLNGLINRYQLYDLEKKNQTASRTIDFIGDQLKDISDSLQRVEMKMELFKGKNVATSNKEEVNRLVVKLEVLELQKTDFLIRKNYFEYLADYINKNENVDPVIAPSSVGVQDQLLSSLVGQMVDIQIQMKMFSGTSKLENPLVLGSRKRLTEIKRSLTEAVRNLTVTEKIKNDYLQKQIVATESQLRFLPSAERKYISIKRTYSLLENLYVFLLQKKSEAGISRASSTTDIVVVNHPMRAGGATSPQTGRNYIIAFFLGLLVPLSAFVLMEVLNTKVQSKEDIEKVLRIPFIGGIGHKESKDILVVSKNPKSAVAESFRALRTNLNYFLEGKEKSVILISSSISGEGKTFTTINLGSVVAMTGKRTLIVGADMRRPKLFDSLNLHNAVGLSNYLAGLATFQEVVQSTEQENLFLVSGGPVPPNPAELLLGARIGNFLEEAKLNFDYIIIDTPPMAIVTDALSLSAYADHTIFIVRQNYTPKQLLSSVKEYYESGRLVKISLMLNDIYKSGPGYGYGYGYSYGYGYGKSKNGYGYYS